MSEIEADMKFSAAAYFRNLAASAKSGQARNAALSQANTQTKEALAEAQIPDSSKQPTLDTYQAPPLRQNTRAIKSR